MDRAAGEQRQRLTRGVVRGQVKTGEAVKDIPVAAPDAADAEVVNLAMCVAAMGLADVLRVLLSQGHVLPQVVTCSLHRCALHVTC